MDKRYQVFVSSTYTDLVEERRAVLTMLLQLGAIPSGMELFPAADESSWELIQRVIEECDYYLVLIGGRYGSASDDGVSFTEREYDLASAMGKPIMALLHEDMGRIPLARSETDADVRAKLLAFRDRVRRERQVAFWRGPADLSGQVALAFSHCVRTRPSVGWVRANEVIGLEDLAELGDVRRENASLKAILAQIEVRPPVGTEDLARGTDELVIAMTADFRVAESEDTALSSDFLLAVTWNDVIWSLGSRLFDECEESELRRTLTANLLIRCEDQLDHQAARLESDVIDLRDKTFVDYVGRIRDADFETMIIQLKALGIIRQSLRSRSVSDHAVYWSLTPYGEQQVIRLRAHRRSRATESEHDA